MESDLAADPAVRQRQHLHCHLVLAGECGRDGVGGVMSKEAMKLALEALENCIDFVEEDYANAVNLYKKYPSRAQRLIGMETMRDDHRKAITALREALAKPDFWEGYVPEPVKPAQQAPFGYFKAEPFGWTDCAETDEGAVALYQHPPAQRTWVDLTFAEICECENDYLHIFARAIEAKLRSKND